MYVMDTGLGKSERKRVSLEPSASFVTTSVVASASSEASMADAYCRHSEPVSAKAHP